MSLAARLFLWQLVLVTAVAAALSMASYATAERQLHDASADRSLSIAATLAHDPFVIDAVQGPDPSALLQPYALELLDSADVDFVTIMDTDRRRYTHPLPGNIGREYIGSIEQALAGRTHTEDYAGTLGPSVRAIVPVRGDGGGVVALVAVGVTLQSLSIAQAASIPQIAGVAAASIALGGVFSLAVSGYLRRTTLGLGPEELRRLFSYYDSALHSVREGLLLVSPEGRLVLYNDHAAVLLGLPPVGSLKPTPVAELGLPGTIDELLRSGRRVRDEIHVGNGRILVVGQQPASAPDGPGRFGLPFGLARGGRPPGPGTIATLRDHTEIESLSGELESMRTLTEALRAQAHEHANRLHTVASLIELGREREALDFAVQDRQASQRLTDGVVRSIDEPFLSALLVGKAAQAHERGIELTLTASGDLPADVLDARDLVTVTGNLLDNAFDAAAGSAARRVWADFSVGDGLLSISVADSGPGIDPDYIEEFLRLGVSGKGPASGGAPRGLGLALVRQAVHRLGGTLEIENDGGAIFTATLPVGVPGRGTP
ncbi:ATP-binding protein [Zafaria sp. Z1313]|uniref:sensor histidine kinase n=1 Tax=unclassified Zafaria TaxID=2828765 RepID=UPI002E7971F5|nr:ATP-binding protein [Zafaria sp. J156]MEE1622547.1 ATP-binding protein [Zafaria sp. J156]